jgi:hypothetical protein
MTGAIDWPEAMELTTLPPSKTRIFSSVVAASEPVVLALSGVRGCGVWANPHGVAQRIEARKKLSVRAKPADLMNRLSPWL